MSRGILGITFLVLCGSSARIGQAQVAQRWKQHDMTRPRPRVVVPAAQQLPVPPPSDAIILFDGTDLSQWRGVDAQPPTWVVKDGVMETVAGAGYLYSARGFGDVQLHVEWAAPTKVVGTSQGRGNSGVFLMGLYEVQVLDSYQNDTYPDGQAGAIYGQYPPQVNACRPPGEWQTYDITFRRPRFYPDGTVVAPARVTVVHNGIVIQDAVEPWGPTSWLEPKPYHPHADKLPLALQDHGNPVRYRNIWLRELDETPSAPAPADMTPVYAVSSEQLQRYVGAYGDLETGGFEVRQQDQQLQANVGGFFRDLVPRSETEFALRWTYAKIVFDVNDQGIAEAAEFHVGGEKRPRQIKLR